MIERGCYFEGVMCFFVVGLCCHYLFIPKGSATHNMLFYREISIINETLPAQLSRLLDSAMCPGVLIPAQVLCGSFCYISQSYEFPSKQMEKSFRTEPAAGRVL